MAIAAPARRSGLETAPPPSRTAPPPEPKKRPRDRPRPGAPGRSSAGAPTALRKDSAPKRKAGSGRKAATAPARKGGAVGAARKAAATVAPKRKAAARASATAAPARKSVSRGKAASARAASTAAPRRKSSRNGLVTAPSRHKAAPRRRARVIPIAAGTAGRAAVAVSQLPESGLIHRLTRGRLWIGLLGILLVGIVALNVVTLSYSASAGKVEEVNAQLSKENSMLQSLVATKYGQGRLRGEATKLGLSLPTETAPQLIVAHPTDAAEAAARLAAETSASKTE